MRNPEIGGNLAATIVFCTLILSYAYIQVSEHQQTQVIINNITVYNFTNITPSCNDIYCSMHLFNFSIYNFTDNFTGNRNLTFWNITNPPEYIPVVSIWRS